VQVDTVSDTVTCYTLSSADPSRADTTVFYVKVFYMIGLFILTALAYVRAGLPLQNRLATKTFPNPMIC
jgi:hypothetical protein